MLEALAAIGLPQDVRAERVSPEQFRELGRLLGGGERRGAFAPLRALAPAKINLGLFVGPLRERDGRHELVSVMQSISLADELTLAAGA